MARARQSQYVMRTLLMLTAVMICRAAIAQIPPPPMQPVDPAVADVSPLSASLRDMQVDLREPLGFKQVYRVPGAADQFMRASGAVYATFPLSAYRNTDEGTQVLVPAGTVFHIGAPWLVFGPPPEQQDTDSESSRQRLNTRLHLAAPSEMLLPEPTGAFREDEQDVLDWSAEPKMRNPWSLYLIAMNAKKRDEDMLREQRNATAASLRPTVANNDAYRTRRLSELLQQAARTEQANSPPEQPHADSDISESSQSD